ncbi:MAG: hypothetical protein WC047_03190 [Kiritimatiellales bacterium]
MTNIEQGISKFDVSNVWKLSGCFFQGLENSVPSAFGVLCSIFCGSSEMEGI